MHLRMNTQKTTFFIVFLGRGFWVTTCSQYLILGKKAVLSAGNRVLGAATASSRLSARPVPHPGKEDQVRSGMGWRTGRELLTVVGFATHTEHSV